MKKSLFIVVLSGCLAVILSSSVFSQDFKPYLADGSLNGRAWQEMNLEQKVSFIAGFREGIEFCSTVGMNIESAGEEAIKKVQQALSVTWLNKMTTSEIVEYFNKFYSDATNRNIPIHEAYATLILRYSGVATEETIIDTMHGLRNKYNK